MAEVARGGVEYGECRSKLPAGDQHAPPTHHFRLRSRGCALSRRIDRRRAAARAARERRDVVGTLAAHFRLRGESRCDEASRRRRDAGRAPRPNRASRSDGHGRYRERRANDRRRLLPLLLDDQADHERRVADALRGRQIPTQRSALKVPTGVRRHPRAGGGCQRRRDRRGRARTDRTGRVPPHGRVLVRRRSLRLAVAHGVGAASRRAAAELSARYALGLQLCARRAGAARRSALGPDLRRVRARRAFSSRSA